MEASLKQVRLSVQRRTSSIRCWKNIKVEMGSLMGAPDQFTPKDHYGTTLWRVYQFDEASKTFQACVGMARGIHPRSKSK